MDYELTGTEITALKPRRRAKNILEGIAFIAMIVIAVTALLWLASITG